MDPYLENPQFWLGFQTGFMTYTASALNELLPSRYGVSLEERV
jgi:hypothetical protein